MSNAPEGCDPVIWKELPEDIRLELQSANRPLSSHNNLTNCVSARGGPGGLGKRTHHFTSSECSVDGCGPCGSGVISTVHGSDSSVLPLAEDIQRWHTLIQGQQHGQKDREGASSAEVFEDAEFPATSFSICGKEDSEKESATTATHSVPRPGYTIGQVPECFCHALASKKTVKMNTPNRGREYYCCPLRGCKYFQWLDGDEQIPSQSSERKACTWLVVRVQSHYIHDL
jgi:hypothetical protein